MSKVIYINRIGNGYIETVSQYSKAVNGNDYRKLAKSDLLEYQSSGDREGVYYRSTRATKEWRDSQ